VTIITVTLNTSVDRTLEVPRLAVGGHLKGRLLRLQPGGKGVNVSRCLAALGVPSIITGLVGSTELGLFRASFAGTPATVELVPIAQPTRTCTTLLDPELGTDTHIREQGPTVTPQEIAALGARLRTLASPDALVVFCGSLPPGMDNAHLTGLIATCRECGAQVAADLNGPQLAAALAAGQPSAAPNAETPARGTTVPQLNNCGRHSAPPDVASPEGAGTVSEMNNSGTTPCGPGVAELPVGTTVPQLNNCGTISTPPDIASPDAAATIPELNNSGTPPRGPATAESRSGATIPQLSNCGMVVVKPNVEELGECLGRELGGAGALELIAAARAMLDQVGTVLLTRGRDGAVAVTRGEALAGSVEAGAPRNTVGCGDAFLAGYLAALWRGMSPGDALRLAVACGAAQAEAEAPGQLSAPRVEGLAARASIRAVT